VRVRFDPRRVTYAQLLDVYWRNVDPVTPRAQFCDKGESYRAAIFALDPRSAAPPSVARRRRARGTRDRADRGADRGRRAVLRGRGLPPGLRPTQPDRLQVLYRSRCGRDARLREVWGQEATAKPTGAAAPRG
jgi:peptide-methionine (S)-S-oxide reductase